MAYRENQGQSVMAQQGHEQRGGSPATTFAMAELQKGERVWFELTQGSIMKRSPPGTAFGGFLMFKT